jgi:hypothetical protein
VGAAPELARSGDARDDHPVIAVELDRIVAERLDRNQRLADDVVSESP